MTIIEINSTNFGSTGNIVNQIAAAAEARNHRVLICCPKSRSNMKLRTKNQYYIGNRFTNNLHRVLGTAFGLNGCLSIIPTILLIRKLKTVKPDIIHLHNLHNYFINLPILFSYIKRSNVRVFWTLHDCWSFTGKCVHFASVNCEKWKTGCEDCAQLNVYPATKVDASKAMWERKKKWFSNVSEMVLITPSQWLANMIKQSYLKDYKTIVINNGIDTNTFKCVKSDFRLRHGISENNGSLKEYMVLGVAFGWGERKGLDVLLWLSENLPKDYRVVLVGTTEEIDRKLPKNIISIHRTDTQQELAEMYSAADVFVNPTREDTFPTVNIEALACGTPVITFDTGGSPEIIDEKSGVVVHVDDKEAMKEEIIRTCQNKVFQPDDCVKRSKQFDKRDKFENYIDLFEECC